MDSSNGGSGVEGSAFVSLFTLLLTQYYEHLLPLHPWKRRGRYKNITKYGNLLLKVAFGKYHKSCTWKVLT